VNKTQFKRLEKLVVHMESGQLAHPTFDFNVYNRTPLYNWHNRQKMSSSLLKRQCDTNGCAIGELPQIFPNAWKWHSGAGINNVTRKKVVDQRTDIQHMAGPFFGLSDMEYHHLFVPGRQSAGLPGCGRRLKGSARRSTVANHLRKFLEVHRKPKW